MRDDEPERAEDYTGPLDLPDHHDPVDEVGDSSSPTHSVIDDALDAHALAAAAAEHGMSGEHAAAQALALAAGHHQVQLYHSSTPVMHLADQLLAVGGVEMLAAGAIHGGC